MFVSQREENIKVAQLLIDAGAGRASQEQHPGEWPVLGLCAHHGHTEMLSVLIGAMGVEVTQ